MSRASLKQRLTTAERRLRRYQDDPEAALALKFLKILKPLLAECDKVKALLRSLQRKAP